MADNPTIDLADFSLDGRRMSSVRHSVAAARRSGLRVVPWTPALDAGITSVSEEWLRTKRGGEMGFTLGRVDRFDPTSVDCRAAIDGNGNVVWVHDVEELTERACPGSRHDASHGGCAKSDHGPARCRRAVDVRGIQRPTGGPRLRSDDLRAWIDNHCRTDGHWSVAGLSEGGYGAAHLGSRTPGQYDSVCSMSGNFTPEGNAFQHETPATRDAATPLLHSRPDSPRTLLIAGTADRPSVRELLRYAQALHVGGQKYQSVVVPGGHDWGLWHREFPRCLRFMLGAAQHRIRPHRAHRVTHVSAVAQ